MLTVIVDYFSEYLGGFKMQRSIIATSGCLRIIIESLTPWREGKCSSTPELMIRLTIKLYARRAKSTSANRASIGNVVSFSQSSSSYCWPLVVNKCEEQVTA